MARVSVIIPTFNRYGILCRAVESVLRQSYTDVEIIVVDDGSTDETPVSFPQRFPATQYVRIDHAGLPAVVRNEGVRIAKGEYIAFLDSDDQWLPDKLLQQIDALERCPSAGLICSNAFVISDDSEQPRRHYLQDHQGRSGHLLELLFQDNFVITSTAVVRRSLFDRVGLFEEHGILKFGEDYDLWLRIAAVSEVIYLPRALAVYRDLPSASVRDGLSEAHKWQSRLLIARKLRQFLKSGSSRYSLFQVELREQETALRKSCAHALLAEHRYLDVSPHLLALCIQNPLAMGKAALRRATNMRRNVFMGWPQSHGLLRRAHAHDSTIKLHLGCGENYLPGYINIDFPSAQHPVQQQSRADVLADLTTLTYSEGTVDEIRLHHVFEHFERPVALRLLIEWYAWLKEGGRLIIETPDFDRCVREYLHHDSAKAKAKILRHLFGSHEAQWAVHCDGWYRGKFEQILAALGYQDVECCESEWQGTFNITVAATKRAPGKPLAAQLREAESFLALSLIDDSPIERQMLQVWMAQLNTDVARSGALRSNGSPS